MNYFPNGNEEKELIRFIAQYQYINSSDVKYFFSSSKYYKKRICNLIAKKILRRIKLNIVLDQAGIEYAQLFELEYNKINRNKKYLSRLLYLSSLGAYYNNSNTVKFIPSFSIKDKQVFTNTSRKYAGILNINGLSYLTYYISKDHTAKGYINSVIYDIQKEKIFRNIIILVNNIEQISLDSFTFGANQVLIIQDTQTNRENLKYLNNINYYKIIKDYYKNNMYISKYNFCEYTDYKTKYISTFYFIDTEKINRIKNFLRENRNKCADILCTKDIKDELQKRLVNCNYIIVDFEKYIDKEIKEYD